MVRVPIWFNADEMKQLKEKCEGCGQSPYGYIKELVMLDLNKNVGEGRMEKVESGEGQGTRVDQEPVEETGLPW